MSTCKSHNNQKKIAAINDISGFGRCSLAVEIPIISYMRLQCCPVITSVFSNHTGYDHYFFDDYTDKMEEYIDHWKRLGLEFNGISSGFLGSAKQIEIVEGFFKYFKKENTIAIVDPVMGDYGKCYPSYTDEMCRKIEKLVRHADIITPNLTEACVLTGREYSVEDADDDYLSSLARELIEMGPEKAVITGVPQGEYLTNVVIEKGFTPVFIKRKKIGENRSGTGDVFLAIIAADAVNGVSFTRSVIKAVDFIEACIRRSIELDIPLTDGVCFEEELYKLERN